jgi:hypothetical protein
MEDSEESGSFRTAFFCVVLSFASDSRKLLITHPCFFSPYQGDKFTLLSIINH